MTTVSVPLTKDLEEKLDHLASTRGRSSRAAVMRYALERLAEEQAIQDVLEALKEPTIKGDWQELLKRTR